MSAALANPAIVKITTVFKSKLADIDLALFASADTKIIDALNAARDDMFGQIRSSGSARYEVGISVSKYHAFYKQLSEKAWRDQVGPIVIDALGYRSLKSLYNLMADADLAHQLGARRREALVALGVDPASRKYAELVKALLPAPPSESPQNAEAAVTAAHSKFLADRKPRSELRKTLAGDPQEFKRKIAERLVGTIVGFTNHVQGQDPTTVFNDIAELVRAQLADEAAKPHPVPATAEDVAKSSAGPVQVAATGQNRPAKGAGSHEAAAAKPALVPPNATKSFRAHGPTHPWGNACLNSLRIISTGYDGAQQLEFNRQGLYDVREDRSPKRFLVDDFPDLFDVESDDVIREHLSIFGQASWHVFQLLTNNMERAKRIKSAMNARSVMWPLNVWVGTSIESREDLPLIKSLAEVGLDTNWISFADYRSNSKYPLVDSALAILLKGCLPRWIVGRADLEDPGPDFSLNDALYLKRVAWSSVVNSPIFFAQPRTKAAFVRGEDVACPVTRDPNMTELIETRAFPDGFQLQRPTHGKPFSPCEREPVEIIGYLSGKPMTR
jgi:protein gp37